METKPSDISPNDSPCELMGRLCRMLAVVLTVRDASFLSSLGAADYLKFVASVKYTYLWCLESLLTNEVLWQRL